MGIRYTVAATAAIVLALAATTASAGIIISEEVVVTDQAGHQHKSEQSVMLQGNKQKVVTADRVIITDLDAGKMVVLIPASRKFAEVPFPPAGVIVSLLARQGSFIDYAKSAGTGKAAGYDCQNYAGTWTAGHLKIDGKECVANAAAGAKEYVAYRKTLADKLKGTRLALKGEIPDGVPVSTTVSTGIIPPPIPRGFSPAQIAEINKSNAKAKPEIRNTKVTKIEVKDLPAGGFAVPADYSNLKPNPSAGAPGVPAKSGTGGVAPKAAASPAAH
jgi:hypothetical protein